MLPPYELKNKEFSKAMRGYNTTEVDEHIGFIIEKYTELYRENDELERKLKTAYAKLDEIKNEEESIRNAMINAQRASAKLMTEANDRADIIINTARKSCDRILADFKTKIQEERAVLLALNSAITDFKERLFKLYSSHIAFVEDIPVLGSDEIISYALSDDSYTSAVVQNIKNDIIEMTRSGALTKRDDDPVSEDGFVCADNTASDNIVRSSNVKDTIKELNKRFRDEQDGQITQAIEQFRADQAAEQEAEKEYGDMLKNLGVVETKSPEKKGFNEAYATPENYGESIKKARKKKQ